MADIDVVNMDMVDRDIVDAVPDMDKQENSGENLWVNIFINQKIRKGCVLTTNQIYIKLVLLVISINLFQIHNTPGSRVRDRTLAVKSRKNVDSLLGPPEVGETKNTHQTTLHI